MNIRRKTPILLSALMYFGFSPFLVVASNKKIYTFTDRKKEAIILQYNEAEVQVRRVSDERIFTVDLETLPGKDQKFLKKTYSDAKAKSLQSNVALTPGQVVTLEFPELGNMSKGRPARCELSVPKNFDFSFPVPLLVWFSGGSGSYSVIGAKGIVDFETFLVLALPYPAGRLPRLAVNEGDGEINTFWEFQKPMLDRVVEMVPNISEEVRIAGGSSSGGHLVGSALDQKWRGFCDYFTGLVLHEGGHSPNMEFRGARSSHRILVAYGEHSNVRDWQEYFIKRFDQARGQIDYIEVPNAGHGLNSDARRLIRKWIEETFEKHLH